MKDLQGFIKSMVKIDYLEDFGAYGHYPFQLVSEDTEGKMTIGALLLGGDVEACYSTFAKQIKNGDKRVYLSVDFPAGGDIDKDFVAVFSYENEEYSLLAIPYNIEDGSVDEQITESETLVEIKAQFLSRNIA